MLILATTLPLPAGYFMPIFIYGESGRLLAWTGGDSRPWGGQGVHPALGGGGIQPWRGGQGLHSALGEGGLSPGEGCIQSGGVQGLHPVPGAGNSSLGWGYRGCIQSQRVYIQSGRGGVVQGLYPILGGVHPVWGQSTGFVSSLGRGYIQSGGGTGVVSSPVGQGGCIHPRAGCRMVVTSSCTIWRGGGVCLPTFSPLSF